MEKERREMAWRYHCQRCGTEYHGYPSEELVESAIEAHMGSDECSPALPDGRWYVDYHKEEPDGRGGWRDVG